MSEYATLPARSWPGIREAAKTPWYAGCRTLLEACDAGGEDEVFELCTRRWPWSVPLKKRFVLLCQWRLHVAKSIPRIPKIAWDGEWRITHTPWTSDRLAARGRSLRHRHHGIPRACTKVEL